MTALESGCCSVCRQSAERAPTGKWWHQGRSCQAMSIIIARPTEWEPAEFIPDDELVDVAGWQVSRTGRIMRKDVD